MINSDPGAPGRHHSFEKADDQYASEGNNEEPDTFLYSG